MRIIIMGLRDEYDFMYLFTALEAVVSLGGTPAAKLDHLVCTSLLD